MSSTRQNLQKSTPCVGICSTTYGDRVCRGCKRYAHEIDQWNSFTPAQKEMVWQRLFEVRAAAVRSAVEIADRQRFDLAVHQYQLPEAEHWPLIAYELLRCLVRLELPIAEFGLSCAGESTSALNLLKAIDGDIFQRSLAHFEHSFRVSAL